MRSLLWSSERGTVTVELAIGIPTVLGIVSLALGALRWGMDGVSATTVASETAFAISRGVGHEAALSSARSALPTAAWSAEQNGSSVCVRAEINAPFPLMHNNEIRQCVAT